MIATTSRILFCFLLFAPATFAQIMNGRFVGSVYTWEKFDSVGVSKTYARGALSAFLDYGVNDLNVRTHIQGASLFQSPLEQEALYRVYYLYAKWRKVGLADISVGRVPFYAGVGVGTLDGGLVTFRLPKGGVQLTAFGGANVPVDQKLSGWKSIDNNFTVGGQMLAHIDNVRGGLSYLNRERSREEYEATRPDSMMNPMVVTVKPPNRLERYLGADLTVGFPILDIHARYDHDMRLKQRRWAQVGVRVGALDNLWITADYISRGLRHYWIFSSFVDEPSVNEIEGGVDYLATADIRVFGRVATVSYETGNALRYSVGASHRYVSLSYRGNGGDVGELGSLNLEAMYPLLERMVTPSIGLSYVSYQAQGATERIDTKSLVFGATVRPLSMLSVDLQGQWLQNEIYNSDFRFMGVVNYWFSEQF